MENNKSVLDRVFEETGVKYDNAPYINWSKISINHKLSEKFMREFKYKIDWNCISKYQKLSEDFIREFKNKVNWGFICIYQKLSENFIREFKDKVAWVYISKYQKLSENFIREFKDKVIWDCISVHQNLSEEFMKEFNLKVDAYNWLYKDTEFKKNRIIELGLYECHDDHFIAYKSIRKDRHSHYNFQYQYLKGETYECHCDCTDNENSFGLSAWTQDGAMWYSNNGLIVKVKINYEDVGRVVHDGYDGKIRCFKLEVLD